ncbi:MAG: FAD-dependent oxidoreductase [Pirellulales bacterium]
MDDDCAFRRRDSLYFAGHWWHGGDLRREYECRRAHGFDVDLLEHDALTAVSSIRAACAIRSRGDAEIDPFRFTASLLKKARERGLDAYARTPVLEVIERADDVVAVTEHHTVHCKFLIFATGYESKPYLPDNTGDLQSTYAVTSAPMPCPAGWPDECLLWESSRPYFYGRRTVDGRCMIGGEDTAVRSTTP